MNELAGLLPVWLRDREVTTQSPPPDPCSDTQSYMAKILRLGRGGGRGRRQSGACCAIARGEGAPGGHKTKNPLPPRWRRPMPR
jgi:hypothetical protein